ncbi:MAG: thermostable hemolysin [Hydrogenophaga sp.]|uniref:thermostable hemolysin n=1 Tax=Hydrogenophaga sp. TaxID=1904254 RepID=UPI001DE5FF35|nr:thermostable hemolysin [Hydrogenophaga sp.]MBX3609647.1 thermostable hemolysin [Hydrogenophaga sp.]
MTCSAALRTHPDPAGLTPPAQHHLSEYLPGDAGRPAVEAFIRQIFHERFGAEVRHFAPVLLGLHDASGALVAAAGYRAADAGPLFLERYLDGPIEARLQGAGDAPVPRGRIAEVGHLAAARAGEGRRLILMMAPLMAREGFEWIVSTLTQELRQLFVRMGVAPLALGVADPDKLGEHAGDWGSYYNHRPLVQAGQLQLAMQALQRRGART